MQKLDRMLVGALGWYAPLLYGDPCVLDRWRWLRDRLRPGPLRTLDAGCGSGAFSNYAAIMGNTVVAVSNNEANNRRARERAEILGLHNVSYRIANLASLEGTDLWSERFDQIICMETVEHIADDRKVLADLARLLSAGGQLLLSAPYKFYRPLLGDALSDEEDGGHVRWGYTHDEMAALLAEAKLEVVERGYLSGLVNQQLTNLLRLLNKVDSRLAWAITLPLRPLALMDRMVTDVTRIPYLSICMVARKPARSAAT
jgi:2-polyprenyl-3-methyl-5-hydroxy-6-metoxy-1,4-benzoquinol methylase